MKVVKKMDTLELFAYSDVFNSKITELVKVGNHIVTVQAYQALSAEDSNKLLDRVKEYIDSYSDSRNLVNEEISNRIKSNFKLTKGPIELDKMISKMVEDHPVLNEELEDLKSKFDLDMAQKKMDESKREMKKSKKDGKTIMLDT